MAAKNDKPYVDVGSAVFKNKYPRPKQSANTLFNFMKKQIYLKQILQHRAIIPRYVNEDISYLGISEKTVSIPMTCFCDISIPRIEEHTKIYGRYGIAFYKDWCISRKIQPIHYINPDSGIQHDFLNAFSQAERYSGNDEVVDVIQSYLLSHLMYMKPLYGESHFSNKVGQNFHDEREWRYVPTISEIDTELPPLLYGKLNNNTSRDSHNLGLTKCKAAWLSFNWSDIKYILVPNEKAKKSLVSHIISSFVSAEIDEKYDLLTKLVKLDEMKEDV